MPNLSVELWPLFHYILWDNATDGQVEAENWGYNKEMNEAFAKEIFDVYEPGDISMLMHGEHVTDTCKVWIQDYHLLLLPSILRSKLPTAIIGFFLHTPFPSSEIFRCLPSITMLTIH